MIDKESLTPEQLVFYSAVVSAGFPADDAAFRTEMQTVAAESHLEIANPSKYSAFWRFVESAVATPVKSVVRYLVTQALPGFYVKTATGARLDLIAWGFNLTRKSATSATGKLTFTRAAGAVGVVEIPAGTRARSIAIDGTVYRFQTTADALMEPDANSVDVPAEAVAPGKNYNLGRGYYSILDSDVPKIGAVTNGGDYLTAPGSDDEPDEELRLRCRDAFLAAGDWHTDAKYRAMISARSGIRPDRIYFDHNIPRGPGSADAYIIFDAGTAPGDYLADLNYYIGQLGNHGHGDDLVCKAIPESPRDLQVSVRFAIGTTAAEKETAVAVISGMIRCAFWDNLDYADDVTRSMPFAVFSFSRLAAELHGKVAVLSGVTFSVAEIDAALELPKIGNLTVTEAE